MSECHIVKYEYDNGVKLPISKRILWCGIDAKKLGFDFTFQDAQHALLAIEQGLINEPCKECLKNISVVINSEL